MFIIHCRFHCTYKWLSSATCVRHPSCRVQTSQLKGTLDHISRVNFNHPFTSSSTSPIHPLYSVGNALCSPNYVSSNIDKYKLPLTAFQMCTTVTACTHLSHKAPASVSGAMGDLSNLPRRTPLVCVGWLSTACTCLQVISETE